MSFLVGAPMSVRPEHVYWCHRHYESMEERGRWIVPRSGLVFEKRGGRLILVDRLAPGTPLSVEDYDWHEAYEGGPVGDQDPDEDYADTKLHFEAAGIPVGRDV